MYKHVCMYIYIYREREIQSWMLHLIIAKLSTRATPRNLRATGDNTETPCEHPHPRYQ